MFSIISLKLLIVIQSLTVNLWTKLWILWSRQNSVTWVFVVRGLTVYLLLFLVIFICWNIHHIDFVVGIHYVNKKLNMLGLWTICHDKMQTTVLAILWTVFCTQLDLVQFSVGAEGKSAGASKWSLTFIWCCKCVVLYIHFPCMPSWPAQG